MFQANGRGALGIPSAEAKIPALAVASAYAADAASVLGSSVFFWPRVVKCSLGA